MRSNAGAGAALNLKFEHAVNARCSWTNFIHRIQRCRVPSFLARSPARPFMPFFPPDHVPVSPSAWIPVQLLRPRYYHGTCPAPHSWSPSTVHPRCHVTLIQPQLTFYHSMHSLTSRCFQGNDSRIGFEDTLNDPYMSPEQPHTHKTMEQVTFGCFLRFSSYSLILTAYFNLCSVGRFSSYPLSSAMAPAIPIPCPTSTRFDRANKPQPRQALSTSCTNRFTTRVASKSIVLGDIKYLLPQ
jgi:hypothetical protein